MMLGATGLQDEEIDELHGGVDLAGDADALADHAICPILRPSSNAASTVVLRPKLRS